jgi:hypothetical protein
MIIELGINELETCGQILKCHPGQKAVTASGFLGIIKMFE